MAENDIRIGILAVLVGPYAILGEDGIRGVELAVNEFGGKIGEKPIVLFKEATSAVPDVAYSKAVILLARDSVDFIIGPLSGNEGLAIRNFAKTRPNHVFLNGSSGAQDLTFPAGASNFYTFSSNGVQWVAGVGTHAFQSLGYRRMVSIGEDYSFPYAQVGGFALEFCREGGQLVNRYWVPLGTGDFKPYIENMPTDIDAIYVALGGTDVINFILQYEAMGRKTPIIAGSIAVDQSILSTIDHIPDGLLGTIASGAIADDLDRPAWREFADAYNEHYPDAFTSPSLFTYGYYANTKAALLALKQVNGDLSNGQQRFKAALDDLTFESPTGPVKLDQHRHAIANTFITELARRDDGTYYNKLVQQNNAVKQTLGLSEEEYLQIGQFDRDNPPCQAG